MKTAYIKPETVVILMPRLMGDPTASLGNDEAEEFDAKQNGEDLDLEEIEFDMWK